MPSTYTGSGIELIADGEQSGTWGQTTNDNLQIIDRMTSQAGAISLSGTTHTLTISDGTLSDGQYGVLVFGGSPSGTNTVTISPNDAKRIFIVKNSSGQSVVLTQGSGGNVTIPNGQSGIIYCDGAGAGAAVADASSMFNIALSNLATSTSDADGDFFVVVDSSNNQYKLTKGNINISGFNNDSGFGVGSVTSVAATAGTGISISGSPITSSGTLTITNTAPDQTVVLNAGTGISTSGTYPNFTVTNTAPDQTVSLTAGSNVTVTGSYPSFTIASTDTTYSAGAGLSLAGTTFSHADTSSQSSVDNSGSVYIQDIALDTYGHVTSITSTTVPASAPSTAQVLSATAGASYGAVGTYSLIEETTSGPTGPGTTFASTNLFFTSNQAQFTSSPRPSGTWLQMSYRGNLSSTIMLRIS